MEKHLKTLNIAILALFAANTLFFSMKNTIFEVVFFKLPISATDIFIIIDYIVFIFLIINVLLIIVVQIKNKKVSLTKLNIAVLVIFIISIIFTFPFSFLYEIIDDTESSSTYYGETLYLGKSFAYRKYYDYEKGKKHLSESYQYIYIPIVNKIITIDSDGSMTSFTFKVLDVEYQKSSILIIDKTDDYEDGTIYVRKKHDDKNQ